MSFHERVGWLIRLVLRLPFFGWEIQVRFTGRVPLLQRAPLFRLKRPVVSLSYV
jgi:hypothetical protein